MCQERFGLNIRKYFSKSAVMKVFLNCVDVALRDVVSGHGVVGW